MKDNILTRRHFLGASALVLGSGLLPGISLAQADDEQVLRVLITEVVSDWSPLRGGGRHYRYNSLAWAAPMYYDVEGNLKPFVFTTWLPNDDFTVWTFTVADNAVFSDGSPITGEDVKESWELAAHPSTRNQRVDQLLATVVGFREVLDGQRLDIEGITLDGDRTVIVNLMSSDPIFALKLANHVAPIVKKGTVRDADGNERSDWYYPGQAVSSGPFKLSAYDPAVGSTVWVPNEHFFIAPPKLSRIEITVVEDSVISTVMLQKGQADANNTMHTASMRSDLGDEFVSGPLSLSGEHFWLNVSRKPTDDIKVREALILAIDRQQLYNVTVPDKIAPMAEQILSGLPGVDPDYPAYPYDPDAARKALAESSYGSADNLPNLNFVGIREPQHQLAAEFIAEQWRQVLGITRVGMKSQADSYSGADQDFIQIFRDDAGTGVPDEVSYLQAVMYSTSANAMNKLGNFSNAEIDAILDEAAAKAMDDPARAALARKAQLIFRDQWAYIPWFYKVRMSQGRPWVKDFGQDYLQQIAEPWRTYIDGRVTT